MAATGGGSLLLVGASGLAREVLPITAGYDVRGILDDRHADLAPVIGGVPVLGPVASAAAHSRALLLLCIGPSGARAAVHERLDPGTRFATVVDPSVRNPAGCPVGVGSILLAGVTITADALLGAHVVAMPGVTVTHDCVVADFATLAAGVSLGGGVRVGRAAYLGMNAAVHPGVRIGAGATVGMGAVVLTDVPDGETWAGVPARRIASKPAAAEPEARKPATRSPR
ncbi:sugar O-acyltransferase (sialic acid O-acetyltransferase NeuD family) [Promicromonospora sp. AC04]|uniref:NeuD/PglB/VioB family sugar acetyltransferase n=1 Tax=Promicromonospora sp. AC04 TaxID=2135723 RepID=UPI000D367F8F|nr:NeuD/PglB/VioB family sugar acetyltransferase [Promicromonospora sp. AC04]PUB29938.1 sugar O-acyltransferase (sialic acid O-acetyltransferase NeuD family) [Promicromonospora sp. AC04]